MYRTMPCLRQAFRICQTFPSLARAGLRTSVHASAVPTQSTAYGAPGAPGIAYPNNPPQYQPDTQTSGAPPGAAPYHYQGRQPQQQKVQQPYPQQQQQPYQQPQQQSYQQLPYQQLPYQQQGYPQQGYPQQGHPQQEYPQQGYQEPQYAQPVQVPPPATIEYPPAEPNVVRITGLVLSPPYLHNKSQQPLVTVKLGIYDNFRLSRVKVEFTDLAAQQLVAYVSRGMTLQVYGSLDGFSWTDALTRRLQSTTKIRGAAFAVVANPVPVPEELVGGGRVGRPPGSTGGGGGDPLASPTKSYHMYYDEALGVGAVAQQRQVKPTTVLSHLIKCAEAGMPTDWPRLMVEVGFNPQGPGPTPREVASVVLASRQQSAAEGQGWGPRLTAVREAMLADPALRGKVEAQEGQPPDPTSTYAQLRLVGALLALQLDVEQVWQQAVAARGAGP